LSLGGEELEMDGFFGKRAVSIGVADEVGSDALATGIFLHIVKLY
jgi:hypothetical protein